MIHGDGNPKDRRVNVEVLVAWDKVVAALGVKRERAGERHDHARAYCCRRRRESCPLAQFKIAKKQPAGTQRTKSGRRADSAPACTAHPAGFAAQTTGARSSTAPCIPCPKTGGSPLSSIDLEPYREARRPKRGRCEAQGNAGEQTERNRGFRGPGREVAGGYREVRLVDLVDLHIGDLIG